MEERSPGFLCLRVANLFWVVNFVWVALRLLGVGLAYPKRFVNTYGGQGPYIEGGHWLRKCVSKCKLLFSLHLDIFEIFWPKNCIGIQLGSFS